MNQIFSSAFQFNNLEAMKIVSKIIALSIRNEMEDFHSEYISDKQMPELNRLIRTGIYNALFALSNYEMDSFSQKFVNYSIQTIPDYWEDPQLHSQFNEYLNNILEAKVNFRSEFLNEQYRLGNIYLLPNTLFIRLKFSSEYIGVDYDDRKSHKDKITNQLRKEEYQYNPCVDSYLKPVLNQIV